MKTTQKLLIALMLALIISGNGIVKAQGNENPLSIPTVGLGIHINQLNKIIVPINIIDHIRLEPAIGFSFLTDKNNNSEDNELLFGFGVYGMWQKGQLNMYAGLKSGFMRYTRKWDTGTTDKRNQFIAGPAIGCEYFFGQHFSFGGLLGFSTLLYKEVDGDDDISIYSTDADLILRFYF
jgi:hypothetical protein